MGKERKIQLADMHDNGIRFSRSLKARKKEKDAKEKMLNKKLNIRK